MITTVDPPIAKYPVKMPAEGGVNVNVRLIDPFGRSVWGSGGGVRIEEVCMRCGCSKTTDTWAQDPSDGEQGLDSTSYVPRKYAGEVENLRQEEEEEEEEA